MVNEGLGSFVFEPITKADPYWPPANPSGSGLLCCILKYHSISLAADEKVVGYRRVISIFAVLVGLAKQVAFAEVQPDISSRLFFILTSDKTLPLKQMPTSTSLHHSGPPLDGIAGLMLSFLLKLSSNVYAFGMTFPFNVKSSSRNVPVADAPDNEITILTVPLRLFTGFVTAVVPIAAPVVGIVPEPTAIPLIVIDQFCAPVALRWRQRSKLVIFNLYPAATFIVSVIVGLPPEFERAIASPVFPA